MKNRYAILCISALFFVSCQNAETKPENKSEAEETADSDSNEGEVQVNTADFQLHKPCSFSIKLPSNFILSAMYNDTSKDYCDYEIKSEGSPFRFMINSMIKSRFEETEIAALYAQAQETYGESIFQKSQIDNWFVISANDAETGNIICWKRVVGENYISDLKVTYDAKEKARIEPYLEEILNTFESD